MQDVFPTDADAASEAVSEQTVQQQSKNTDAILEVSEPPSPNANEEDPMEDDGPSVIANMLRKSPPESASEGDSTVDPDDNGDDEDTETVQVGPARRKSSVRSERRSFSENTPLLGRRTSRTEARNGNDLEEQKPKARKAWLQNVIQGTHDVKDRVAHTVVVAADPRRWDRKQIWQNAVLTPASCLPAVAVGLLLNILDALSYGKQRWIVGL